MRLNLATRQFHADVDGPWLDLLRPSVGVADYLNTLVRTYGLVAPFESARRYSPDLERVIGIDSPVCAGLIAQDLVSLGLTAQQVASIPTCPDLSIFHSTTDALGWFYVVERSTLLQDGVRRYLHKHLDIEHASSYLAAYEGHVSHRWASFGRVLDRVGQDEQTADEIVRAACDAFITCRHWFRTTSVHKRSIG